MTEVAFELFPVLPFELRSKICGHYLDDEISQMYRFTPRYPRREIRTNSGNAYFYATYQVFLQPTESITELASISSLEAIHAAVSKRRIPSLTCAEALQTVLEHFPYTLKFRYLPRKWGRIPAGTTNIESPAESSLDGSGYSEYILRYNSSSDIIILDATGTNNTRSSSLQKSAVTHQRAFSSFVELESR